MTPFDFVNSISFTKKDLLAENPENEKQYVPYVVNKALSYFVDTIFVANEVNMCGHLDKRLQYDLYINIVRKRRRFSKWHKANHDDITYVQKYYQVSFDKAKEMLPLLSEQQLTVIKGSNE